MTINIVPLNSQHGKTYLRQTNYKSMAVHAAYTSRLAHRFHGPVSMLLFINVLDQLITDNLSSGRRNASNSGKYPYVYGELLKQKEAQRYLTIPDLFKLSDLFSNVTIAGEHIYNNSSLTAIEDVLAKRADTSVVGFAYDGSVSISNHRALQILSNSYGNPKKLNGRFVFNKIGFVEFVKQYITVESSGIVIFYDVKGFGVNFHSRSTFAGIVAYNEDVDMMLVMNAWEFTYWGWIKSSDLFEAMSKKDDFGLPRGIIYTQYRL